jgi:hypothetical protein
MPTTYDKKSRARWCTFDPVKEETVFHHVAMFRFKDDVPEAAVADIAERLRALPALVPSIRGYEVGRDAGLSDGAWDLVVIGAFDDEAGWRDYATHPDHVPIVHEIRDLVAASARMQTTDLG